MNTLAAFSVARGPVAEGAKDPCVHLARERRRLKANADERHKRRYDECSEVVRMVEVLVFGNEVYHLGRVGRRRLWAEREMYEQPATLNQRLKCKKIRDYSPCRGGVERRPADVERLGDIEERGVLFLVVCHRVDVHRDSW